MTNEFLPGMSQPIPMRQVRLTAGFWAQVQSINRQKTIPHVLEQCRLTGRLEAFRLSWNPASPYPKPHRFWDSDVAKWLEGACLTLVQQPDPELANHVAEVATLIADAQQSDGYLNTHFTVVAPEQRWCNLKDNHELYCAGHIIEAAVAHFQATGAQTLLEVACRLADRIGAEFGRKTGQEPGYPGHQQIELALVKLYRATGISRYLRLASFFLDERGRQPHFFIAEALRRGEAWPDSRLNELIYNQSHQPIREQMEVTGHAVRALYMYAAMADLVVETGDMTLFEPLLRLWQNATGRRMYITGGIGPTAAVEGFTFDYDLPNESAYAETCAAIALVMFAHRLLQLVPDAQFADVMERALYNGVLSGVSLTGDSFFYANPLAMVPQAVRHLSGPVHSARQPWFDCACCPTNMVRHLASLGAYFYSQRDSLLFVHLYGASVMECLFGATRVVLRQETNYPWAGAVRLEIAPERPIRFTVALRLPGWCKRSRVYVNEEQVAGPVHMGYLYLTRNWTAGDAIRLDLDMPVERMKANPSVRQTAGLVALQRGPVVYCLEEIDNGPRLHQILLPPEASFRSQFQSDLLGGVVELEAVAQRQQVESWGHDLYSSVAKQETTRPQPIKAIPFARWANRGVGEMRVWIREGGESIFNV